MMQIFGDTSYYTVMIFFIQNNIKYKGGFVNGLEEGSGVQEDKNGNRYEGFFKQGKKDGPFVETDKNGKLVRKGTYKMGRLSN